MSELYLIDRKLPVNVHKLLLYAKSIEEDIIHHTNCWFCMKKFIHASEKMIEYIDWDKTIQFKDEMELNTVICCRDCKTKKRHNTLLDLLMEVVAPNQSLNGWKYLKQRNIRFYDDWEIFEKSS